LVAFALDILGRLALEGEVGVKLCSDATMAAYNRKYRQKAGPTDVLSFADGSVRPEGGVYLGDIVIAVPVAARQAKEAGHSLAVELQILLLHGLLHLAGYDHETDGGTMGRKERALRKEWGI
jgi:probable rRNA maturation factor